MTPAPLTMDECATWNCTVMKPPEEMPDTEVWLTSMLSPGSGGAAIAGKARAAAMTPMVILPAALVRSTPPKAKQ